MASNLTIEAPDFARIRKGDNRATEDAIRLLWFVANQLSDDIRKGVRQAQDRDEPKIKVDGTTTSQNNYPIDDASILIFTGGSAISITGFRAPETGKSRRLTVLNLGTGTHTIEENHASSADVHRILHNTGTDAVLATGAVVSYLYYGGKWREWARV